NRVSAARRARAAAGLALFLPRDIEAHLGSSNRFPKTDVETVLELRALFGDGRSLRLLAPEELAENVAKISAARECTTARRSTACCCPAATLLLIYEFGEIEPTET